MCKLSSIDEDSFKMLRKCIDDFFTRFDNGKQCNDVIAFSLR